MATPKTVPLSRREREIMDVMFALARPASAEDIRAGLSKPPSYSAVRAMLVKLEAKKCIRHREEGLRYIYEPTTPRLTAQRTALQRLVDVFFDGSPGETVAALLKQEAWTEQELDQLSAAISQARKQRKTR